MRYILVTYDENQDMQIADVDLFSWLSEELAKNNIEAHLHEFSRPDSVLAQVQQDCMEAGLGVEAGMLRPEDTVDIGPISDAAARRFEVGDRVRVKEDGRFELYSEYMGKEGVVAEALDGGFNVRWSWEGTGSSSHWLAWFGPEEIEHV